jgi:hypothetical protein
VRARRARSRLVRSAEEPRSWLRRTHAILSFLHGRHHTGPLSLQRNASGRRAGVHGPARAPNPARAGQRQDRRRNLAVPLAILGRDRLGARAHGAHEARRGRLGLLQSLGARRRVLGLGRGLLGRSQHTGCRVLSLGRGILGR